MNDCGGISDDQIQRIYFSITVGFESCIVVFLLREWAEVLYLTHGFV